MAVSYSNNRVTVTPYKTGVTASASTNTLKVTSGDIASGDVGRLVAVQPNGSNSGETEVRQITGVSGGTISIHDPFTTEIASGVTWVVAHTLEDVHGIGNAALEKVGDKTYRWDGDWNIISGGFLGDTDISLEMRRISTLCPIASGCIAQFGLLWGGEGSGIETTGGCRLRFDTTSNNASVYASDNSRDGNGGVVNYYACLIHSEPAAGSEWMFQRMRGPTRFIGCNFDGPMGGRFYHEASEWVQCRMTGNNNAIVAWSIGATFDRDIESILSYRNNTSMKSYKDFGGTLRDVILTNNGQAFNADGDSGSTFNFIDSTEFDSSDLSGTGGIHNMFRSVVLNTTDNTGADLSGVTIRINDKNDDTQGSVQESDVSGNVPEILALRFKRNHNSSTYVPFFPFRIRSRKYGFLWQSINTPIADPIKQATAINSNSNVTQTETTAQNHTGISVTDHGASPVSWNGKTWGITITGNLSVNSGLTASDIEHYLHYHLAQNTAFEGKANGLEWHNLAPVGNGITENGDYGGTIKGVRVVDENGNAFPGFTKMQSDDGTFFVPPVSVSLTFNGLKSGSEVHIYETGTQTELAGVENSGTSFTYNYQFTANFDVDFVIFALGYQPIRGIALTLTNENASIPISQVIDRVYDNPV